MMRCLIVCVWSVSLLATAAGADWLSVPDAPVADYKVLNGSRAADGTSWFVAEVSNAADVVSAKWTVAGLGVFDVYVNGQRVGDDFLKPGFTHYAKTKYSFSYDVAGTMKKSKDAVNHFAAEVSAGWWRDKILTPSLHEGVGEARIGFTGKKSAFRGVLEVSYADGSKRVFETNTNDWRCAVGGPVVRAAIFDGEDFDARIAAPVCGGAGFGVPEINTEFKGEVLPSDGAEICLRHDLAMEKRNVCLVPGVTNVIDFGQNCAAVPAFRFRAKPGTRLCVLPAEMLNADGTVYRDNLREIKDTGALVHYTFCGGDEFEDYMPRFTYFGYRYLALAADGEVEIESVRSIPVSSIRKDMEIGKLEVGDPSLNRFIQNVYWSLLSNYLSVPTDCPQRNERLGWSADTQVFCEAGAYMASSYDFLRKWMRDMCDSRDEDGGFPSVAPFSQYGNETFLFGWADAGVIVPYRMWKMFGDTRIIRENFAAMAKFVRKLEETKYDFEGKRGYIFADWLSLEKFETRGNRFGGWTKWKNDPEAMEYRRFLAACYWLYDARMMVEMAESIGNTREADWFRGSSERALAFIRGRFVASDGLLVESMRELQTACVFALRFGIVTGDARAATLALLKKSITDHGGCLRTGFLGTSFLMDVLADANEFDVAYGLLFQHKCPSWLYSVDQGATTVWERWNSYVKGVGFGPVDMNSFNHYAYGAVIAWIYRHAAGIAADPSVQGFRRFVLSPKLDRRLGYVTAEYKSAAGLIKSAWRYEGEKWIWKFTVPEGATASVTLPGETEAHDYPAGTYTFEGGPKRFRPQLTEGDMTKAVQSAIDDCFRAGGGVVRLGKGKWHIGGIRVRSNVTLYLESGCTLVGTRDISRYFILENDTVEPVDPKLISHERWYQSDSIYKDTFWRYPGNRWNNALIRLYKAENAAIIGEPGSLIDGSNPYDPEGEEQYRGPLGVNAIDCTNLVFRGYTTNNTGNWAHRLVDVEGFTFDGVTCLGGHDSVHFNGCDGVLIENCTFKTGDDCIAGFDNHKVTVRNCYINSSCSAFRFGGNDVLVEKCTIKGPGEWGFRGVLTKEQKMSGAPTPPGSALGRTNMLSFFTYYADGTHPIRDFARRIVIRDCTIENTDRFLHYNYNNEQWQRGVPMTDITFERVKARGIKMPLCACGAQGYDVKLQLTLRDCDISFMDTVDTFIRGSYIGKIVLDNVTVSGVKGDLLLLKEEERPVLEVRGLRGVKNSVREGTFDAGNI